MTRSTSLIPLLLLLTVAAAAPLSGQTSSIGVERNGHTAPLFIENRGQWGSPHQEVFPRFAHHRPGMSVWITDSDIRFDLFTPQKAGSPRTGHVLRMRFVGGATDSRAVGLDAGSAVMNYPATNYAATHKTIRTGTWERVGINNVYPGVDAILSFEKNSPRYDLVVAPLSDPSLIRIAWEGALSVRLEGKDRLVTTTSLGDVVHNRLVAYQMIDGVRRVVPSAFHLNNDMTVGFDIGEYDQRYPLVIDPLIYSTYLGGLGQDQANAIAVAADGTAYIAGSSFSANFPTTPGAYSQTSVRGEWVVVSRISRDGTRLLYSTYIGPGRAQGIAVGGDGTAYVTGTAYLGYPATIGSWASPPTGNDVFITHLDSNGATLIYSSIVGPGTGNAIALRNGEAYITGATQSRSYPVTAGVLQQVVNGMGTDAFVTRMSSDGSRLRWSTLLGGVGGNVGTAITIAPNGEAIVVGHTNATTFPVTASALQSTYGGGSADAFAVRVGNAADSLVWGTYLGGSKEDSAWSVAIASSGAVHLTGGTHSPNFPSTTSSFRSVPYDSNDVFVAGISYTGDTLLYGNYIGDIGRDVGRGIAIDQMENIWIGGITSGRNFPVTRSRYQATSRGGVEAFLAKFSADGGLLLEATYFGGTGDDDLRAMARSNTGDLFITGYTTSTNLPVTPNVVQIAAAPAGDAFVASFASLNLLRPTGGEIFCAGTADTIRWTGNPAGSYRILISNNSGRSYTLVATNVTGTSYLWPIGAGIRPDTTYRIRVETSNGDEFDTSDSDFMIGLRAVISGEPTDQNEPVGDPAMFLTVVEGFRVPTFQWQVDTGGGTWQDIPTETNSTLRIPSVAASMNSWHYRLVATNECGSDTSRAALLAVSAVDLHTPNGGESYCTGDTVTISFSPVGNTGPYRLELSDNSGINWVTIVSGITDTVYKWVIPEGLGGMLYRVRVVLAPPGASFDASNNDFTINSAPRVTSEPQDLTIDEGDAIVLTLDQSGFPTGLIRWEMNDGSGWTPITNATFRTLTVYDATASWSGRRFRATLTNVCGADTTREAVLTVTPDTSAGVGSDLTGKGGLAITVAPNPARDRAELIVRLAHAGAVEVWISDMQGRQVVAPIQKTLGEGTHSLILDISSLPSGNYSVAVKSRGFVRRTTVSVVR